MKTVSEIVDPKNRNFLRFGSLLLSTLVVIGLSVVAYARIGSQKMLNIGGATGGTIGARSTAPVAVGLSPGTMVILSAIVVVFSLSLVGLFRPETNTDLSIPSESEAPSQDPEPTPPEVEEWEDSAKTEESTAVETESVDDILQSLRQMVEGDEENTANESTGSSQ